MRKNPQIIFVNVWSSFLSFFFSFYILNSFCHGSYWGKLSHNCVSKKSVQRQLHE